MKVPTSAACLALLAVSVPLARASMGDVADYAEVPSTDATTADDNGLPDYDDADVPAAAVSAMAPTPDDLMAPVPADVPTADDPAAVPMEVDEMWEQCLTKLGDNATHSLADLVTGPFETRNTGPSVFLPLIEKADAETQALLADFDLSGEGYTLILPVNEARDYNSSQPQATAPVFEVYDFDPNTTTSAEVTKVLQAHVLPGTLTYTSIIAELESNGTYTVESLQGYKWTFALALAGKLVDAANATAASNTTGGEGGAYPVIVDNHNITTAGFFNMDPDIRIVAECPNAIIASSDGFFAAPQFLSEPAEAPAPVPAPAPAPAPTAEEPAEEPEDTTVGETGGGAPPPDEEEEDAGTAAGVVGGGLAATAAAGAAALMLALL